MATKKKTDVKREPPKLDMFKRVLPNADRRNKSFYDTLTDEERKEFDSGWLIMRYLSSAEHGNSGVLERYLIYTNELVNVNFSDMDPELRWKLMSVVGCGQSVQHPFIRPPSGKRKKKNPFKDWIAKQHPHLSDQEVDIWVDSMDKKSAKDMLEQFNVKDKDIISSANDL
jgi:hypothetical protein